jgi:hypothetical protein
MMRLRVGILVATGLSALPVAAYAQNSAPRIELIPQVGYAVPGALWKGPFGTSIRSQNSAFYGVQLGVNLTPVIGLVGGVAFAQSDLEAGLPVIGGAAFGTTETIYYDAGLQLRMPIQGLSAVPFLQAGAGGVHHKLESSIVEVSATNPAFHVGGGLDLNLSPAVGVRLQVRDYIGRFDAQEAIFLDVDGATSHTLAFTVGLRVGI